MIDDGCDLNRWLWAGQMTSSGGGVMRRGHRITAPSLCVYGSLTVATKQIAQQPYQSINLTHCLSHSICLCACTILACETLPVPFQKQKADRGFDISHALSHPALWVLCLCLFIICVYLAAWCQSVASIWVVSHP